MIKYVVKENKNKKSPAYGKWYAYPVVEETMNLAALAKHMEEHNTGFSEAMCLGMMTAMVKCIKEQLLAGKNVKIDNLAIFSGVVLSALYCTVTVWSGTEVSMLLIPFSKRRLLLILFSQASQCICGVVVNTTVLMSLAKVTIATIIIVNITKIFFITFLFALIIQL